MTTFEVIDAKPWHYGQMSRILRDDHRAAIVAAGVDIHRQIALVARDSCICRAWLIDGRLAALGGVVGTMAGAHGYVWLTLSNEAMRHPRAAVQEARAQLADFLQVKRELATTIIESDLAARRFAVFLGFHVDHDGAGAPAASRAERRALLEFLAGDSVKRLMIGAARVIPMGYHGEDG